MEQHIADATGPVDSGDTGLIRAVPGDRRTTGDPGTAGHDTIDGRDMSPRPDMTPGGDAAREGDVTAGGVTSERDGAVGNGGMPAVDAETTVDRDLAAAQYSKTSRWIAATVGALTAIVVAGALWLGADQGEGAYAGVLLAVQVALVGCWCVSARPPAVIGVAVVGLLAAAGADAVALWGPDADAGPLAGVIAGAFIAAIVVQLARGVSRKNVTEAFGVTMTLAVAVTAFATTISLIRQGGTGLINTFLLAAGVGIVVARLLDLIVPRPKFHESMPRGLVGLAIGGLVGGLVAAISAASTDQLTEPSVPLAAAAGWAVATTAVLTDLAAGYSRTGRALAGDDPPPTSVRYLLGVVLGPLLGLTVAAPAGYVFGLVLLS